MDGVTIVNNENEIPNFDVMGNNVKLEKKEINSFETTKNYNTFLRSFTKNTLENGSFPFYANEENIVDTTIPVIHGVNGPKKVEDSLILLLRLKQGQIAAETPEYVSENTLKDAKLHGVNVNPKKDEKSVFYAWPNKLEDGSFGEPTKQYYYNLSQLDDPAAIMNYIQSNYEKHAAEVNAERKAKFDKGEYKDYFPMPDKYPDFKSANPENTLGLQLGKNVLDNYNKIASLKGAKDIDPKEYQKQLSEAEINVAQNMLALMFKAGSAGVCVKMTKGDNELLKNGLQNVLHIKSQEIKSPEQAAAKEISFDKIEKENAPKEKLKYFSKWLKETYFMSKKIGKIVINSPSKEQTNAVKQEQKLPSQSKKVEEPGYER